MFLSGFFNLEFVLIFMERCPGIDMYVQWIEVLFGEI